MNNATETNSMYILIFDIFHHLIGPCSGHGTLGSDGNCICEDWFKGTDCSGEFTITIILFGHTTLWQYGLLSFQTGVTKLERFLLNGNY